MAKFDNSEVHECLFKVPASDLLKKQVRKINKMLKNADKVRLALCMSEDGEMYVDVFMKKETGSESGLKPGPKKKVLMVEGGYNPEKIRAMIAEFGPAEAAKKLGVGQATMYRRLKEVS